MDTKYGIFPVKLPSHWDSLGGVGPKAKCMNLVNFGGLGDSEEKSPRFKSMRIEHSNVIELLPF